MKSSDNTPQWNLRKETSQQKDSVAFISVVMMTTDVKYKEIREQTQIFIKMNSTFLPSFMEVWTIISKWTNKHHWSLNSERKLFIKPFIISQTVPPTFPSSCISEINHLLSLLPNKEDKEVEMCICDELCEFTSPQQTTNTQCQLHQLHLFVNTNI